MRSSRGPRKSVTALAPSPARQGGACPDFNKVDIAADNYTPIKTLYKMLSAPQYKAETPTMKVLAMVGELLKADKVTAAKTSSS